MRVYNDQGVAQLANVPGPEGPAGPPGATGPAGPQGNPGPAGTTDHGLLTGLSDDDHTQYHTDARGDARYTPLARLLSTQYSLTGGGSLSADRMLNLVGDVASPGNSMLYGTNGAGVRGWYAQPAAGGSPGGSNTQLQFNDGGVFAGSNLLTYDKVNGRLSMQVVVTPGFAQAQGGALNGLTFNLSTWSAGISIEPTATIASYTVGMPPSPIAGQLCTIMTSQTITTLNITTPASEALVRNFTTLPAGTGVTFMYFNLAWRQITGVTYVDTSGGAVTGTFTGTLTGCTTSPTGLFRYVKVGNLVSLWKAGGSNLEGTSNLNSMRITGIPAAICPTTNTNIETLSLHKDNGILVIGSAQIDGSVNRIDFTMGSAFSTGGFTSSGTKGIRFNWGITYQMENMSSAP